MKEIKENKLTISSIPLNLAGSHAAHQMQNMLNFLAEKFPNDDEKIRLADETKQDLFQALMYSQAPEKLVNNFLEFLLDMDLVGEEKLEQLKKSLIQAANQSSFFDKSINLQDSFISFNSKSLSENSTNQCRMISTQNKLGSELIYSQHQFEKSSLQKKNSKVNSEKQHAFILFKTEVFYKDQGQKKQLTRIFKEKLKKHVQILLKKPSFQRLYHSNDVNLEIPVTVHIVTDYAHDSPLISDLQRFFKMLSQNLVPMDDKKFHPRIIYNNLPPSHEKPQAPKELPAVSVNAAFLALTFSLDILLASIKKKLPFQQNSNLWDIYKNLLQLTEKLNTLRQTAEQSGEQKDQLAFIRLLQSGCEKFFDFKTIEWLTKAYPSLGQRLQLLKNVANLASDQQYNENGKLIEKTTASPEALEINIAALLNKSGFVLEVSAPENSTLYSEINFHLASLYQFVAEKDRMPQLQNQSKWEEFKESYQPKPNEVLIKPFQFDEKQVVKYPNYQLEIKKSAEVTTSINLETTTESVKIPCNPHKPQLINRLLAGKIDEKKLSLRQIRELNDFVFMGWEMTPGDCQRILGVGIEKENLTAINQHNQMLFSIYATDLIANFKISNLSEKAEKLLTAPMQDLDWSIWQLRQVIGSLKAEAFRMTGGQKQLPTDENEKTQAVTYLYLEAYKMHYQQAGVLGDFGQQEKCQEVLKNPQSKGINKLEKLAKNSFSNLPDEENERLIHQLEQRYVALQWYQSQLGQIKKLEIKNFPEIEHGLKSLLGSKDLAMQMQQAAKLFVQFQAVQLETHPLAILCKGFVAGHLDLFGLSPTQKELFATIAAGKFGEKQTGLPPSAFFEVMPSFYEANAKAFEKGDVELDMMRYLAHVGQSFDPSKNGHTYHQLAPERVQKLVELFHPEKPNPDQIRLLKMLPQHQVFLPKITDLKSLGQQLLLIARWANDQQVNLSNEKNSHKMYRVIDYPLLEQFWPKIKSQTNDQQADQIDVKNFSELLGKLMQISYQCAINICGLQTNFKLEKIDTTILTQENLKNFCTGLKQAKLINQNLEEKFLAGFKLFELNQMKVQARVEKILKSYQQGSLGDDGFDSKPIIQLADSVLFRAEKRIDGFFEVLKNLESSLGEWQYSVKEEILRYFINHVMQGFIPYIFSDRHSASQQIQFLIVIYQKAEDLNTQFEQPIKNAVCRLLSLMTNREIKPNEIAVKEIFKASKGDLSVNNEIDGEELLTIKISSKPLSSQSYKNSSSDSGISFSQFKKEFDTAKEQLGQEKGVMIAGQYAPEDHGQAEITLPTTLTENKNIDFAFRLALGQHAPSNVFLLAMPVEGDFDFNFSDVKDSGSSGESEESDENLFKTKEPVRKELFRKNQRDIELKVMGDWGGEENDGEIGEGFEEIIPSPSSKQDLLQVKDSSAEHLTKIRNTVIEGKKSDTLSDLNELIKTRLEHWCSLALKGEGGEKIPELLKRDYTTTNVSNLMIQVGTIEAAAGEKNDKSADYWIGLARHYALRALLLTKMFAEKSELAQIVGKGCQKNDESTTERCNNLIIFARYRLFQYEKCLNQCLAMAEKYDSKNVAKVIDEYTKSTGWLNDGEKNNLLSRAWINDKVENYLETLSQNVPNSNGWKGERILINGEEKVFDNNLFEALGDKLPNIEIEKKESCILF